MTAAEPKPGQTWRAIPYTAENVLHLHYVVESVEGSRVTLTRDDGVKRVMSTAQLHLYCDLENDPAATTPADGYPEDRR